MASHNRFTTSFRVPHVGLALLVGGLFVFTGAMLVFSAMNRDEAPPVEVEKKVPIVEKKMPDVELTAAAAVVWDVVDQKILFEKNAREVLPLASVTKVMTALVASEILDDTQVVTFTAANLATEGDNGFFIGEQFLFRELVDFMLVASSNDAAEAIASSVEIHGVGDRRYQNTDSFMDLMNERAVELGLENTSFRNPSGLDINEYSGENATFGTAYDMVLLFDYVLKRYPDLLEATTARSITTTSLQGLPHTAPNTNIIAGQIPRLLGSKTGYTTLAGGNLVVTFDAGVLHPVVIAVLGSTKEERFSDVEALHAAAVKFINENPSS